MVVEGPQGLEKGMDLFDNLPLGPLGSALLAVFAIVAILGSFGLLQVTVDQTLRAASEAPRAQYQLLRLQLIAAIEAEMNDYEDGRKILKDFYFDLAKTGKKLKPGQDMPIALSPTLGLPVREDPILVRDK